jgi:hypothetical protein
MAQVASAHADSNVEASTYSQVIRSGHLKAPDFNDGYGVKLRSADEDRWAEVQTQAD